MNHFPLPIYGLLVLLPTVIQGKATPQAKPNPDADCYEETRTLIYPLTKSGKPAHPSLDFTTRAGAPVKSKTKDAVAEARALAITRAIERIKEWESYGLYGPNELPLFRKHDSESESQREDKLRISSTLQELWTANHICVDDLDAVLTKEAREADATTFPYGFTELIEYDGFPVAPAGTTPVKVKVVRKAPKGGSIHIKPRLLPGPDVGGTDGDGEAFPDDKITSLAAALAHEGWHLQIPAKNYDTKDQWEIGAYSWCIDQFSKLLQTPGKSLPSAQKEVLKTRIAGALDEIENCRKRLGQQ